LTPISAKLEADISPSDKKLKTLARLQSLKDNPNESGKNMVIGEFFSEMTL